MMYTVIAGLYRSGKLSAADVWRYADAGKITTAQAATICGARPKEKGM